MSTRVFQFVLFAISCFLSASCLAQKFTLYHNDIYGTPIAASDYHTGQLKWRETYTPFGIELTQSVDGVQDSIGFAGKEYDSEVGLNYFNARYYNPDFGRFLSPDPAGVDVKKIETFNRYSYGLNNPYRYTDPSGEVPVDTILDIGFLVYDTGKAGVYGSMALATGNPAYSAKFVGAMGDVALDLVGLATPYVPTVALRAGRAGIQTGKKADEAADVAKEIEISRERYGEAADHIADAQQAGYPDVLEIAREGAAANRSASIGGLPKVPGKQLDEYPPAMFKEGGSGASVRAINGKDNMAAGACIGNACRGLANGEKVRIKVVP